MKMSYKDVPHLLKILIWIVLEIKFQVVGLFILIVLTKFSLEKIKDHILTMRALTRDENKTMYIMGRLKSRNTVIDTSDKNRQRYMYSSGDKGGGGSLK